MSDSETSGLSFSYSEEKLNDISYGVVQALIAEVLILMFQYFVVNLYEILRTGNDWFSEDKDTLALTNNKKAENYEDAPSKNDNISFKENMDSMKKDSYINNYTFGGISASRKNPETFRNSTFDNYLQNKSNFTKSGNIQKLEAQSEKNIRKDENEEKVEEFCPSFNKLEDPLAGKFVIGGGTPPGLSPKFARSFQFDASPENNNNISNLDPPEQDVTKADIIKKDEVKEEITKKEQKPPKNQKNAIELREEIGYHFMYHTICLGYSCFTWANVVTVFLAYMYLINIVAYIYLRLRQNKKSNYAYFSMMFINFWIILVCQFRTNLSES